jgi:hypothetical protein
VASIARCSALRCESSTSVEIAWTLLDTILRLIFFSLLRSAIYDDPLAHRFGRSVALTRFAAAVAHRKMKGRLQVYYARWVAWKGAPYVGA